MTGDQFAAIAPYLAGWVTVHALLLCVIVARRVIEQVTGT